MGCTAGGILLLLEPRYSGRQDLRLVVVLVVVSMFAGAVAAAAFSDDHGRPLGVTVDWLEAVPSATVAVPEATRGPQGNRTTPAPTRRASEPVTGFMYPIVDACLPVEDSLMPGAPRDYRNGIHEGVDFYDVDNCAIIGMDTEVLAAKAGVVIRADHDYEAITAEEVNELQQRAVENGSSEDIEDAFRGRQLWLQHDDGTVTRYAHLNGIAEGIDVGATIEAGEVIAFVGDSGTPESVSSPGSEAHLHFEIRLGASYLGQGLDPEAVRELYITAFGE